MEKETRKIISADIQASTIPEELKALYLLADAVEIMNSQIFERIKWIYAKNGYNMKENELLTGITDYCKEVKKAQFLFSQKIEPQISGATFGIGGSTSYDSFNRWANELCRLVLLYLDRNAGDKEAFSKVFTTLRKLKPGGVFKDEDISKYKMK